MPLVKTGFSETANSNLFWNCLVHKIKDKGENQMLNIRNEEQRDYETVENITRNAFYIMNHSFVE